MILMINQTKIHCPKEISEAFFPLISIETYRLNLLARIFTFYFIFFTLKSNDMRIYLYLYA
jgi:hypothetical protein